MSERSKLVKVYYPRMLRIEFATIPSVSLTKRHHSFKYGCQEFRVNPGDMSYIAINGIEVTGDVSM